MFNVTLFFNASKHCGFFRPSDYALTLRERARVFAAVVRNARAHTRTHQRKTKVQMIAMTQHWITGRGPEGEYAANFTISRPSRMISYREFSGWKETESTGVNVLESEWERACVCVCAEFVLIFTP